MGGGGGGGGDEIHNQFSPYVVKIDREIISTPPSVSAPES